MAHTGERVSVSAAMRRAGYSESYAKNPQQLTNTRAWSELLEDIIPIEEVMRVHRSLLLAREGRQSSFPVSLSDQQIMDSLPSYDQCVRIVEDGDEKICYYSTAKGSLAVRAIDMAYKLYGYYKIPVVTERSWIEEIPDGELDEMVAETLREQGWTVKRPRE